MGEQFRPRVRLGQIPEQPNDQRSLTEQIEVLAK